MSDPDHPPGLDGVDLPPAEVIGTETCANCGARIDEYEWFPIRGRSIGDGEFRVFSFCDEACVDAWDGPGG